MNLSHLLSHQNHTISELLLFAEDTVNDLALALYDRAIEEAEETDDDDDGYPDPEILARVFHEIYNGKWNKSEAGVYVLGDFHEDNHANHHHVCLNKYGKDKWDLYINHCKYGEHQDSFVIVGTLKEAKEKARKKVGEIASKGTLWL